MLAGLLSMVVTDCADVFCDCTCLQTQSFDQTFDNMNAALKLSCLRGLPVRVVRSFKEKRSSYAPSIETPVRYDGIYRILRCWRKKGAQGFLMCRWDCTSLQDSCHAR
jgi:hypothetical protein